MNKGLPRQDGGRKNGMTKTASSSPGVNRRSARGIARRSSKSKLPQVGSVPETGSGPPGGTAAIANGRDAAGNAVGGAATVTVAGVRVTHASRPLWPGLTKRDLAEYWCDIAPLALDGIARRPLAILRCPQGINGKSRFFQKHGRGAMPRPIREGTIAGQPYLAIDDLAGLIACAQIAAIELHPWGATEADAEHPDRLVFDLDPGEGVAWPEVVAAAGEVRDRLVRLGLAPFCRTTGGKGLHVVTPLSPGATWEDARVFTRGLAEAMARDAPRRFTSHVRMEERRGRILVDWLRNGLGATAVASYSPRARPGALVATPLGWSEVTQALDPAAFTIGTLRRRIDRLGDPWATFAASARPLPGIG